MCTLEVREAADIRDIAYCFEMNTEKRGTVGVLIFWTIVTVVAEL